MSVPAQAGRSTQPLETGGLPAASMQTPPGGVRQPQSAYTGAEIVGPLDPQRGAQSAAVSQCGGGGHQVPSTEHGIPICRVHQHRCAVSATHVPEVA
jgi:hypothetical protein